MSRRTDFSQIYQRLIEIEYQKLKKRNFNFNDPKTFIKESDVISVSSRTNISDLVLEGLLIPFGDGVYRTTHFDLIFRLINVRNREHQSPIPLEYKIVLKKEFVPDFERYKIKDVLPQIIESSYKNLIIDCLKSSLNQTGKRGLSSHQFPIVKELLSGSYENVAIVAPTASGKTLAYFIPLLVRSIERAVSGKGGVVGVLIYPRKALERDQLKSLMQLVDIINTKLRNYGHNPITIGIDDSDTPREGGVREGDSFRKLRCVTCDGDLILRRIRDKFIVICKNCEKEFPYIIPTKDEIWRIKPTILITNIWIVYRRLLSSRSVNLFRELDFVVVDEAHVYTHFLGGHVSYILKMLRFVSNIQGRNPIFVFSSATIPNPKEFIAALAGVDRDQLFYVDFQKTLENAPGKKLNRILLYLYLLPHPNKSVETLTEALVLPITLWCHKNNMKGITFIDSISEINTIMDYIHTTILGIRKGREVIDHLFQTEQTPTNDYCWITLASKRSYDTFSVFEDFVLGRYKRSIGMHYGGLSLERRAEIESEFSDGRIRMLLSTSTLELGIDLSDVATIVQHKLPLSPEGVVQRIGRAGRDPKCHRIALGVIVLPPLPLSTLYMFDDRLRETLENVSFLPPLRIGEMSHNINLQHVLSLLLLKRALENKKTYVDIDIEGIKNEDDIINSLREIKTDLDELLDFNRYVNLFSEEHLKKYIYDFKELIEPLLEGLGKMLHGGTTYNTYDQINDIKVNIENGIETVSDLETISKDLYNMISKVDIFPSEIKEWYSVLVKSISLISSKLFDLKNLVRWVVESKNPSLIDEWLERNIDVFNDTLSRLPTSDEVTEMSRNILNIASESDGISFFRKKYNLNLNQVIRKMSDLGDQLGSEEEGFLKFLNELPFKLEQFKSINFEIVEAKAALKRVKNEIKLSPWSKIDIFQMLSLILEGKAYFSLLLDTPSPDLELIGVEEV